MQNANFKSISRICYWKYSVLLGMLTISFFSAKAQGSISEYNLYWATGENQGQNYIILRSFKIDGALAYLAVNPTQLKTKVIKAAVMKRVLPTTFSQLCLKMGNTPYIKALLYAQAKALPLQDAGITHALPKEMGITLTIDLCPSHKGLDRDIFTSLMVAFKNIEKPVPVALSLTGRFLFKHEGDMIWLKGLVSSGQIDITWVNHTYNHHYDPSLPLNSNFLLEPGTDINLEVLQLESAMIAQGLVPSVFFRFPGLISTQQLVNKVGSYGLISIGSDAWLAKGQEAKPGSLVLIHGNGNEPIGVEDFIKLIQAEAPAVQKKQWLLYDLRTSVLGQ